MYMPKNPLITNNIIIVDTILLKHNSEFRKIFLFGNQTTIPSAQYLLPLQWLFQETEGCVAVVHFLLLLPLESAH